MIRPEPDQRSLERRARDEQIASAPKLPFPELPHDIPVSPVKVHLSNQIRTELFAAIQSLSESIPEMRVGQMLAAVGELCADLHGRSLWDATDAEFLEAVWQFHRKIEAATVAAGSQGPGSDRGQDHG